MIRDSSTTVRVPFPMNRPTGGRSERRDAPVFRNFRFGCGCSTLRRPATMPMTVHNGVDPERTPIMAFWSASEEYRQPLRIRAPKPYMIKSDNWWTTFIAVYAAKCCRRQWSDVNACMPPVSANALAHG